MPTAAKSFVGADFCSVDGCGGAYPFNFAGPLTKLFIRTSGDVTVRAFEETVPQVLPLSNGSLPTFSPPSSGSNAKTSANGTPTSIAPISPICETTQALVAEVSNPGAIGEVTVPLPQPSALSDLSQPFEAVDSSVVGVAEGSPIEVITVHVDANVNTVEASFSDGTSDEMSVADGWAVLVDDGNAPLPAMVTAFDSSGTTIGSATVTDDAAIAEPAECFLPLAAKRQTGGGTVQPAISSK